MNHRLTTLAGLATIVLGVVMAGALFVLLGKDLDATKLGIVAAMLGSMLTTGAGLIAAADGRNVPVQSPPAPPAPAPSPPQ